MRDKTISRSIEFTKEDIQRLGKLAEHRNEIFEEYVSNMIPRYLIPILESEQKESATEGLTDEDFNALTNPHLSRIHYQYAEYREKPNLNPDHQLQINGHTRRLFPIIVIVRTLMQLLNRLNTEYVIYELYRTEVYETSKKLKKYLMTHQRYFGIGGPYDMGLLDGLPWIPYEDGLDSGYSRSTSTSIAERMRRSESHFHQYYSKANPTAKNPGILLLLNLVYVEGAGKNAQIKLTEHGRELATKYRNPLLDDVGSEVFESFVKRNPLSYEEKNALIDLILLVCKDEARRMVDILEFIGRFAGGQLGDGIHRNEIQSAIENKEIVNFSKYDNKNTINKQLSGVLGRLWDLELIGNYGGMRKVSRIKRYEITSKGDAFIQKYRDSR